jgi:hypothetical protein
MLANPREVALRVYSKVPPGYLRGTVFDVYRSGRWMDSGSIEYSRFEQNTGARDRNLMPTSAATTALQRGNTQDLKRFAFVSPTPSQIIPLEIHNDPMKGPMVFLPLTTHWIEARSREIFVTSHGIIRLGVDVTRPYVAGVGSGLPREELSTVKRQLATEVPMPLQPVLMQTAETVCQSASTATAKAAAISNYFQTEYAYSLSSPRTPRGVDPLTHFLETKHDAHCEFFASATTLMLRSVGVPSRYVTGYVADEPSEEENGLWLARNQDAHAWVEAYDDRSGRWFPVESTPGRRYQTVEPNQQDEIASNMFGGLLDQDDDETDTLFGRLLGWFLSMRATDPLLLLFRLAQLPLFFVLAFVLWTRYLKPALGQDDADVQSRKMLRQVERKLRKHALIREPSETLYQFADRIDQAASNPSRPHREEVTRRLVRTADWYRAYADARYQGRLPEPLG